MKRWDHMEDEECSDPGMILDTFGMKSKGKEKKEVGPHELVRIETSFCLWRRGGFRRLVSW